MGAGFGRAGGGGGSAGGRPRRCSCPFTVSASEAALTRTSAIRLPPGLGPETGGGGAGLGAAGEGGGTSEGTDPLSGDSTPVGEGRTDRKSPGCLDVPSSSRSQHSHIPRNRRVRVGGVLAQGPRQESHPDVRGQEWRMCTRGVKPKLSPGDSSPS